MNPSNPVHQIPVPINQSIASEPVYPSIRQFYRPVKSTEVTLLPPQLPLKEDTSQSTYQDIHRLPIANQDLYCHFLEEIYLSSVLPM